MAAALYMDAVIRPNRSLSERGLSVVIGITIALALIPITVFWIMGATLAPLFVGVDVLALYVALRIAARPGRAERVKVSGEAVEVSREGKGGEHVVWTSPTPFTRVDVAGLGHEIRVQLQLSGRTLTVGAALSPDERRRFGGALQEAIRAARAERHPLDAAG